MSYANNSLDDPKQLHDFLFNLYEFADVLSAKIPDPQQPYATDAMLYPFMVYIEDIMDLYGRQLVVEAAKDAGLDSEVSLREAHAKLDVLREVMAKLKQIPPAVEAVDRAALRIKNNWGTRE